MTIHEVKKAAVTETPLLLFDCEMSDGVVERWSTHDITFGDRHYRGRVLKHNVFDIRTATDDGIDALAKVSLTLANADSYFSQIERSTGWKGSKLSARFAFVNASSGELASDEMVIFRGACNPADEITDSTIRLTFASRMSLQRILLPEVRIQRRCPWMFPANAQQRELAADGGARGKYSPFYRCGYSADAANGVGNLKNGDPYTNCDYTRAACVERGMFDVDVRSIATRRFGGVEFVPSTIQVKTYGEKSTHTSAAVENEGRYNDFVPLVYGTAWYRPPVIFARNDGNLTHMEVLLGMGEVDGVNKVLVDDIELPAGESAQKPTATGWFNIVSLGSRNGEFNRDFTDGSGKPQGDPYGSMAVLSVVVPNRISDGKTLPKIDVLLRGLKLPVFDADGGYVNESFTNNPAWVMLDLLRRSGWSLDEINLVSFARTAAYCSEPIDTTDLHGNPRSVPRFQCNLVIRKRRSAADVIRGVRNASALYLTYGAGGLLELSAESSIAIQQEAKPDGTNSTETLNGGWPAYEFGDATSRFSDIARRSNGEPTLRLFSRSTAETPNRYTVEFQDEFNGFQQDSLSLIDVPDAVIAGQEISASLTALGLPNFSQAGRVLRLQLDKSIRGNTYLEFETGVRGIGLKPGDLITVTYAKEGLERRLFRIVRLAPSLNFRSMLIVAQIHDDVWYTGGDGSLGVIGGGRQPAAETGLPRPLAGSSLDEEGFPQFDVEEHRIETADGAYEVDLSVKFATPAKPSRTAPPIPLMSLAPVVSDVGGTLKGGRSYYYAISAVGSDGSESALSFVARASVGTATNTNSVRLHDLSFAPGTSSFNIYRGPNPTQLLRVAAEEPVGTEWVDTGADEELAGPPDANYHHANFYWRLELLGETSVQSHTDTNVVNDDLQMLPNEYRGKLLRISLGKGRGQERVVLANTETSLTLATAWTVQPDSTSKFVVVEPTWNFGALTETSPVVFRVPNRENAVVHISGRSANVHDKECAYELSPLTRWTIGGAAGDIDVPPAPIFALNSPGQGRVEVTGIGFTDLTNTRTITAGSLNLHCWNELAAPTSLTLVSDVAADGFSLEVSSGLSADVGAILQIDAELVAIESLSEDHRTITIQRAMLGSTANSHTAGAKVWRLERKAFVMPFLKNFFGTPAAGSYSYVLSLPDQRIAGAELYVTNVKGNSQVGVASYAGLVDGGIRTLSGGQISMQVDGPLSIQSDSAPRFNVDASHAVRDVFATVVEAPTNGPIEARITRDGEPYCTITIPAGQTISSPSVDGLTLPALNSGWQLGLDVTAVGTDRPGAGLTVTIRL